MSAISRDKKCVLTDLLKQLSSEINTLYHEIEGDMNISSDRFNVYDKLIENINHVHTKMEEEIYFT